MSPTVRDDEASRDLFNRRAIVVGGAKVALVSALIGRLYYLQVVESDRYKTLADENRINLRLLAPPRGYIVDRNGEPLAVNDKSYRVVIVGEKAADVSETLVKLSSILPLDEEARTRIEGEVGKNRSFIPVTIAENLTWRQVAQIEVNSLSLPGVSIETGQTRRYPQKDVAAHIVGHVGAVNKDELTGDPLLEIPDFKIGKTGVERFYDLALRGRSGAMQVEVNAFGRVIRNLSREPGRRGDDVSLTIDMPLQRFAMKRLARERSAAAVAMDVHNGEVFALASAPSYDPNAFVEGMSTAEWRALSTNTLSPLQNKSAAGLYHPGSTIKQLVLLAALEAGIDPYQTVFCNGHYDYEEDRFHCWKRGGHGRMNGVQAIAESCDVYFYELALKVGIDRIAAMMNRFGLGAPIGLDFGIEAGGVVPTRDWKLTNIGDRWRIGDTIVASIGQGYMLTTPLQLAVMTARMVNGGYAVRPRLSRQLFDPERGLYTPPPAAPIGVPPEHLALVREGMDKVVNHSSGTARKLKIDNPAFAFGGKTGTAQVRRITMAERERGVLKNEDLPWEQRDHALFVGYAPLKAPRYAVSVVVEHGGGGSAVAAPLARELLIAALRRDPSKSAPQRPDVAQAG